ncbi:hypothetical protein HNP84_006469 [Thermocatellispora tengchongensis]|uniref:Uncharacterized protein n=1 Tax=Thermocatellispora tengchongensis TaxID=1073253 RepID=A0A840PAP9_9ACTN|nr:hypothetical protein [Thermocatellispora tengchongensis]
MPGRVLRWANLEHTGASIATKAERDPLCTPEAVRAMALSYLGGGAPLNSHPLFRSPSL